MRIRSQKKKTRGFSLLEIVLALTLLGIILSGVALFITKVTLLENKNREASQSLFIAKSILALLKSTTPQRAVALGPNWKNNPNDLYFFSLEEAADYAVAYDNLGQPKHSLSLEEYYHPLHKAGICFLAHIEVSPVTSIPGLSQVHVTVISPVNFPEKECQHCELSTLIFTFPHEKGAAD